MCLSVMSFVLGYILVSIKLNFSLNIVEMLVLRFFELNVFRYHLFNCAPFWSLCLEDSNYKCIYELIVQVVLLISIRPT